MSWTSNMLQSYIYNSICPQRLLDVTDEVISNILKHGSAAVQQLSSTFFLLILSYFWTHQSIWDDRSLRLHLEPPIFRHQGVCVSWPSDLDLDSSLAS